MKGELRVSFVLVTLFLFLVLSMDISVEVGSDEVSELFNGVVEQSGVDWWTMFGHDPMGTGYSTSTAPNTNQMIWTYTTGGISMSSPVVADDMVFMGSFADDKVYALSASTGICMWSARAHVDGKTSPAFADGKVYIGSHFSVIALDASTGKLIWNYTGLGLQPVTSPPIVADGRVYVTKNIFVQCLDASTGRRIWWYAFSDARMGSPAVAYGRVYVGGGRVGSCIYALNASTGKEEWVYETWDDVYSSPAVADRKVFVGSDDYKVYALNASTGVCIWSYKTGGEVGSSPAVADCKVFVGSRDGKLYAFGPAPNDLVIGDIRPVQVIMDAEALIMNKKTAIRVRVWNTFEEKKWVKIKVIYNFGSNSYVENGLGWGVPLDPGVSVVYIPGGPAFTGGHVPEPGGWLGEGEPWLHWTKTGLDDQITAIVDPDDDILEADEKNNKKVTVRKIVESKSFKILVVPVYFPEMGQKPFNPSTSEQAEFIKGTYPVADNKFQWTQISAIPWPGTPEPNDPNTPKINERDEWLFRYVSKPISFMGLIYGYNRTVVVIQNLVGWRGQAYGMLKDPDIPFPVIVRSESLTHEGLLAHEIGHTYFLWHPHDLGPPIKDAQRFWVARRDYERNGSTLMVWGAKWWIDKERFDSYPLKWNRQYTEWMYNLFDQFKMGLDPEVIVLRGVILRNGTVIADESWYRQPQGTPDLAPGTTGNYSIVLLDGQHQILSQMGFNASFMYFADVNGTLVEAEADTVSFIFNIPYMNGTSTIEIQNATGHVLASRAVSANPPTINVTFPNGGEILTPQTNYTITWEASDLDTDPLTYHVAYSPDAGQTWTPLTWNLKETHYTWNTSSLSPGNSYLIKVGATDGVNAGEDTSDNTFTIAGHDVAVTSITPSKTVVEQDYPVSINVTVENQGFGYTETFNVSVYSQPPGGPAPGLVGYWKFDEGSGTTAYDSSGNDNQGTIYGPAWASGRFSSALDFDGVDDHVNVPYDDSLNITAELTMEAWIKPYAVPSDEYGIIINKGEVWALTVNETGFLYAGLPGLTPGHTYATKVLTKDMWQHVAMTYNGNTVKLYLNGSEASSQTVTGTLSHDELQLTIGANSPTPHPTSTFNGTIDEVKIYNRALSEEEIVADMMYYGIIGTETVTLTSGNSTTVTFTWNTTGIAKGNYTITATATIILGETDTTDNTLTDGWVFVTIPGDVNGDCVCDMADISMMIDAFMTYPSDPKWDANCDVNCDGVVDMADIQIAIDNFMKEWPC